MAFFRIQGKGISFEEMKAYKSTDVDDTQYDGLCCADSVSSLRTYADFGNDEDHEIVIFEGHQTGEIYDGVVVEPVKELARTSISDFMTSDSWLDYEA